ncbi:MAG: NrfD/PsrC family molybdoenzyme membrane anchor subunit [Thermoleophilaceae bacterium]
MSRPGIGATGQAQAAGNRPVIKEPVWTWEIPCYFFTGGLGGASAALAYGARLAGNTELERSAWAAALGGLAASPPLLIMDLGKPSRFLNMLRVVKVTSPMNVGTWLLSGASAATGVAALNAFTGRLAPAAAVARPAAAALGMPVATYTAALVANTSVPAWHEVRRELPFVFGASAVASAGAVTAIATPGRPGAPARRLAVGGALSEVALSAIMERRLDEPLARAYTTGTAGRLGTVGKALGTAGAGLVAYGGGRSRAAVVAGGAFVAAGALALRWSVFRAGFQSAADPDQTVGPQRRRIEAGEARGAAHVAGGT